MKTLVIGATGFVGSAVARAFNRRGYNVHGLARSVANRTALENADVVPVESSFDDLDHLSGVASRFDIVVFCANIPFEAEAPILSALIHACRGNSRYLLSTSGTGVLSIDARDGEWNENVFAEDDPFPFPVRYNRAVRIETERLVRDAAKDGLHTTVIRPPLIYGHGGSSQIPELFESARKTGSVCYVGRGLNLYSNVHVDDLAEVYCLAVERGKAGALYHSVSGEVNFRTLAEAVAEVVGCGVRSVTYDEACAIWSPLFVDLAYAVNSRSSSLRTRSELGWAPRNRDLVEEIRSGSYREAYDPGQKRLTTAKEKDWTKSAQNDG